MEMQLLVDARRRQSSEVDLIVVLGLDLGIVEDADFVTIVVITLEHTVVFTITG